MDLTLQFLYYKKYDNCNVEWLYIKLLKITEYKEMLVQFNSWSELAVTVNRKLRK